MNPERWQKIERLFHAALERSAEERSAFLDEACAGDESLRKDIELLLSADSQKESSIEALPSVVAAGWMAKGQRKSIVGEVIGHYQIASMLGSGGMGEVYLAEDTSLGRRVALKFLPHHYTEDAERVRRFEQEARAASALNHPNIITIYEIGQWNDINFIATEFIEGKTLRERMQHRPLPLSECLDFGTQVANALTSAHGAGIVHRDIKPANVMVRSDGYVKVLDFGLAKLTSPDSGSKDHTDAKTDPGRVMGTINYMSPEQALGQPVDHRTDIFSLGVVLYEMATGKLPFAGNSDAAVYDALLNKAPEPITSSNPELPIELERIINHALEKNRDARYQTAADLRADLKLLVQDSDSSRITSGAAMPFGVRQSFWGAWQMKALGSALIVVMAIAAWFLLSRLRSREPTSSFKNATFTQLTDQEGPEYFPSLSPDGTSLVYASRSAGKWDIYLQRVGGKNPINLTKDSGADDTQPAFSSDGKQVAFRSERDGGGLFVLDLASHAVKKIARTGFNPTWSPDGTEIAYATASVTFVEGRANSQLWAVRVASGETRLITGQDAAEPAWSPHGQRIAFWSERADLWTIAANGGAPVRVTHNQTIDWNPCWSADGKYLYFTSDRNGSMNLWRIAINETNGEVRGAPEPATTPATDMLHLAIARDGRHIAYVQRTKQRRLQALAFDPVSATVRGAPTFITHGTSFATHPSVSPDGQWLAYSSAGGPQEDIYVIRTDGTGLRQLTNDAAKDRVPRWSPDGKRIAFYSDREGKNEIWALAADGSGVIEQLTFVGSSGRAVYPTWSPDGSMLAYYQFGIGSYIIDLRKPWQQQTPQPIGAGQSEPNLAVWDWSPDGKRLACIKFRPGTQEMSIAIYEFGAQDAAPRFQSLVENGDYPAWLNDSRRLLFTLTGKLYLTDVQSHTTRELFAPAANEAAEYCTLSPDNRTIYYSLSTTEADIWLATF